MTEQRSLKDGWELCTLADICTNKSGNGKLIKGKLSAEFREGLFPAFSASGQDVWRSDFEHEGPAIVVSAVGARCGKAFLADGKWSAIANTHVVRVQGPEPLRQFLYLQLNDENFWVKGGSAQPFVKVKASFSRDFELPPLNEQRRIVSKIESLESHREAAQEALEAIPPLLEKFRQSVLAAAFRGDLTREWRAQNPDVEPASVLLERIRTERKARFIEDAAETARAKAEAKARDAGKPWGDADDQEVLEKERGKAEKKYKEPEPVDATNLPELPEGWCWAALGELARPLSYGSSQKSEPSGKVPVLRMGNLQQGEIDWADLKYSDDDEEIDKFSLSRGDVLFNRTNSPALVGKAAVYKGERPAIYAGYLIRITPLSGVSADFVNFSLASPSGRSWCWSVKSDGVSQSNISASKLAEYPVPLAPELEQSAIAEKLQARLDVAQGVIEETTRSGDTLIQLTQSILAKAFRGELVPQDPNDEPARMLLERIRAERTEADTQAKPKKKAARKTTKKAARKKSGAKASS